MKKVLVSILLSLVASLPVFTQDSTSSGKKPEFRISGGLSIPSLPHDFRQYYKTGYNVGLAYGYTFEPGDFGYSTVFASVEHNRFYFNLIGWEQDHGKIRKVYASWNSSTSMTNLMLNDKGTLTKPHQSVAPYFLIGIGYIRVQTDAVEITGDTIATIDASSESSISYSLGTGFDIAANDHLGFFVEWRFLIGTAATPGRQLFPLCVGMRYRP